MGVRDEAVWVEWALYACPGVVPGGSTYLNRSDMLVGECGARLAMFRSDVGR